jgi:hypothetical protein
LRYSYPTAALSAAHAFGKPMALTLAADKGFKIPGAVVDRSTAANHETVLSVKGLAFPSEGGAGFYEIIDSTSGTYLGYIAHVPKGVPNEHLHHTINISFPLTGKVAALAKSENGVKLSAVRLSKGPAATSAATRLAFASAAILER